MFFAIASPFVFHAESHLIPIRSPVEISSSPVEMFQSRCSSPDVLLSTEPTIVSFGSFASLPFIVYGRAVSGKDRANIIAKVWSLNALNYPTADKSASANHEAVVFFFTVTDRQQTLIQRSVNVFGAAGAAKISPWPKFFLPIRRAPRGSPKAIACINWG